MFVGQNYTSAQILAMQNDAIKRVQEMQRLAKKQVENTTGFLPQNKVQSNGHTKGQEKQAKHSQHIEQSNRKIESIPQNQTDVVRNGFAGMLENLNLDEEKLLLIFLIILLINEGADTMLVLALGFILL